MYDQPENAGFGETAARADLDRRALKLKLRKRVLRILRAFRARLGLRESDVILASFPKSGSTWFRFIWANVISELELGGRTVDFQLLDGEMIAEHDRHWYGPLEYEFPRLVKTHWRFDERFFGGARSIFLYRHPCDAMVSYHAYRHAKRCKSRVALMNFSEFIRDEKYGLPAWIAHALSWLPQATTVLNYEALRAAAFAEAARVLADLQLEEVAPAVLDLAVERSSFSRTRDLERRLGRPDTENFESGFMFTRDGSSGGWRDAFGEEDLAFVRAEIEHHGLSEMVSL